MGLCPLGSLGQVYDEDTGWVYNVHRYYDPVLGGFVSPDPIGVEGGVNPHAGAPNPLTWADPLGLTWCFRSALNSPSKQAGINAPYKLGNTAAKVGSGADNVVNGVRLRAQLTGEEIAGGHAFQKHVIDQAEFPGITTRSQFASHIEDVVANSEMRPLSGGRAAYWRDGTIVP
ncbi:RHS repeat-associated core domain-containing protein [Austwickia chelonae]|uniref:RHS repeat-associated core domain-containing protein n=1 Tax=Austwickia chelonae TaxID=100225 RepID=UPI0005909005|nr:RHS repeat-associated core domain-containing protein [Austwickia chelonae]